MLKPVFVWWVSFVILFGCWLLFVDQFTWSESLAGLGAALLATWAEEIVHGEEAPHFWPHVRWFLQLWKIPWDILSGCWITTLALLKHESGLLHEIPFDPGADDRYSAARRAMAIAFTTISPNSMIVGIDRDRRVMLIHMADHGPVPSIARYLGEDR